MMNQSLIKTAMHFSLIILIGFFSVASESQEVVLAFTDTLGRSTSLDGTARSKMLIKNMARADVKQAMFLIKTKTITTKTIDRLDFYEDTGQLLVNAGHNLSMEHRQKSYAYPIDIMKANGILESYTHYHKHVSIPYFYGYSDPELLQQLQNFLTEHSYLPTYITTRVHDDYMDRLYQLRISSGRVVDIRSLEKAYANMITNAVIRYDAKAQMMLGFSPRQVLLLHENDLSAYCIVALIDELNKKGFKIISPEKVFSDPVSNPFFISGFTANSYMPYITGLPEEKSIWQDIVSKNDEEEIHSYLREQGLDALIQ